MKKISIFALALVLVSIVSAFGQGRVLTSKNKGGDWNANNGSIWDVQGKPSPPTIEDSVIINSSVYIKNGDYAYARGVMIQGNGTLNNGGVELVVTNGIKIAGTLNNNGKITANEVLTIDGGTVHLNQGSSITGTLTINGGTLTNSGTIDGDLTIDGGTVHLNQGSSITGTLTINGGTLTNSGTIDGDLTIDGGTVYLNQGSSITGTLTINGGTVSFGGNAASVTGSIVVSSGATADLSNLTTAPQGGLIAEFGANVINNNNNIPVSYAKKVFNGWNFIGMPFTNNISPLGADAAPMMWAVAFDYNTNAWSTSYLHWYGTQGNALEKGNGIFVYLEDQEYLLPLGDKANAAQSNMSMTYIGNIESAADGRWFALANPYFGTIDIATIKSQTQGQGVYMYSNGDFTLKQSGDIGFADGFFVNMPSGLQSITLIAPNQNAKSVSAEREFLTLAVSTEGHKVPVMFAQNDQATEEYDIFDANKMFGDGSVAEPYLVCNGINLCKEEVNSENYTATMNIKSFESRSVEIVADNIPEGYSLTLLDGAVEVEMSEGDVYTADITEGENADRFKLLINKNNVSIADVAETESVRVVNNNRSIAIYGGKNVRTEVYNALGQKVYETSDRTFDLNNVASGAYVLKVQDGKSVSSAKIVVE